MNVGIMDVVGRHVKVNHNTISFLGNGGKIAGMITGVDTFYSMPIREQVENISKLRNRGIDYRNLNWRRMFFIEGVWYYLADDGALARAYEFRHIDGDTPVAKLEAGRDAAAQSGAVIIHVSRITDTREATPF